MYSKHHALASAVVATALLPLVGPVAAFGHEVPAPAVIVYGTVVGVLVDVDHLLVSRARTGDWGAVRFCLSNPTAALADQRRIFEPGEVGILRRLLSHLLLFGPLVALHLLAGPGLAIVVGVVLYVHLLSDVAWDVHRAAGAIDVTENGRPAVDGGRPIVAEGRSGSEEGSS